MRTPCDRFGVPSYESGTYEWATLQEVMAKERRPSNRHWQSDYIARLGHPLGDDMAVWVEHIPESTVVVDCLARRLPWLGIGHPEGQRPAVVCHLDSTVGTFGCTKQMRVHSVAVDGDISAGQK